MKSLTPQGQLFEGIVVKAAMKDTVTVAVARYVKHPKYKKFQKKTKTYLVHAPDGSVAVGDKVSIRQTRPISKRKHFIVAEKLVAAATE